MHDVGAGGAHQEIDEAGAKRLVGLALDDEEVRRPRHQFPEDVEVAELVRRGQPEQGADHQEDEEVIAVGVLRLGHVVDGIDHHDGGDAGEQKREQARGRVEVAVDRNQKDGRDGEHDRGDVASRCRLPADRPDDEAAHIRQQHDHRPRALEFRHLRGIGHMGDALGRVQERLRPQADQDRDGSERIGDRHREAGFGRERDLPLRRRQADLLDDHDVVVGGHDRRHGADHGESPMALFDRRIENQELGERALEGRQAHHREHAEAEQGRGDRHALPQPVRSSRRDERQRWMR